jgi:hypothetical protein
MATSGFSIKVETIDFHGLIEGQRLNPAYVNYAMKHVSETMLKDMEYLIPKDTGRLRASGKIGWYGAANNRTLEWSAVNPKDGYNYAGIQYRTQYKNYTTPGTGPYWDKKALARYNAKWLAEFQTDIFKGKG